MHRGGGGDEPRERNRGKRISSQSSNVNIEVQAPSTTVSSSIDIFVVMRCGPLCCFSISASFSLASCRARWCSWYSGDSGTTNSISSRCNVARSPLVELVSVAAKSSAPPGGRSSASPDQRTVSARGHSAGSTPFQSRCCGGARAWEYQACMGEYQAVAGLAHIPVSGARKNAVNSVATT